MVFSRNPQTLEDMVLFLVLALAAQDSEPSDSGLRFDAMGWYVRPGGSVTITQGSRPGSATKADIDSDIALGAEFAPVLEARWEFLPRHAVGVRFALLDLSGTETVDEDFIYHGSLFAAGRTVRAEMDMLLVEVDYQYTFHRTETLSMTVHLGAEIWGFSGRLSTADAQPPIDTQRSFDSGFWLAGLEVGWEPIPKLELRGSAVGGVEGSHQNFFNVEARALYRPLPWLALSAGYRYQALRFHQSTNESDLFFHGPEVGVELRF